MKGGAKLETKVCKKCGQELPLTMFRKQRNKCKACEAEYCKQWAANNKEYIANRKKQWNAENSEYLKEYKKEYRRNNKEQISEYNKQYREKHKENLAVIGKQYYSEHRDELLKRKKLYDIANKDKIREYDAKHNKIYYLQNKEQIKERAKQWRKDNPEKKRINDHNRRAKAKQLPATLTEQQWQVIKDCFDNKCAYCGKEVEVLTQDHFIAISKGGEYTHNNIIPACSICNSSKHNADFFKWYPKQENYSLKREKAILNFLKYDKQGIQQPMLLL